MYKMKPAEKQAASNSTTRSSTRQAIKLDAQPASTAPPPVTLRGTAKSAAMLQCWTELEQTAKASRAKSHAVGAAPSTPVAAATPVKPAAPALRAIVPSLKLTATPSPSAALAEVRSARDVAGSPRSPFPAPVNKPVTPSPSPRGHVNAATPARDSNSSSALQSPPVARLDSSREAQGTPSPRTKTANELLREEGLIRDREFAVLEQKMNTAPLSGLFTDASMPTAWFNRFCDVGAGTFGPAADFLSGGLKAKNMDQVSIAAVCAGAASVFFESLHVEDGVVGSGCPVPLAAMLGELSDEIQYRHLKGNSSADDIGIVVANLIAAALVAKVDIAYREQARGFMLAAMGQTGHATELALVKTALVLQDEGKQGLAAICNAARIQRTNVRLRDYSLLAGREEKFAAVFANICLPSNDSMDGTGSPELKGLPVALQREITSLSVIAFVDDGLNKLLRTARDFDFCKGKQKEMLTHLCNQRPMVRLTAEINGIGCIKDITGQALVPSPTPRSTFTIKPMPDGSFMLTCQSIAYVDKAKAYGDSSAVPLATIGKFELLTEIVIDVHGGATLRKATLNTRNINQLVGWDSPQGKQIDARIGQVKTTPVKL